MITSIPDKSPERISQLLPTVKCSTCLQPVPITMLGEHSCVAPPPMPTTTERDWLPPRVASPAISIRSTASSKLSQPTSSPPRHDSSPNRLRIDTLTRVPPSPTHSAFKSSPLARNPNAIDRQNTSSPNPGPSMRDTHQNLLSSPLRTRVHTPLPTNNQNINNNNPSNGGSAQSTPSTARPPLSFNQEYVPAREPGPPRARGPHPIGLPSAPRQGQAIPMPSRAPGPVGSQPGLDMNAGRPPTNLVPFPRRPSVPGHNNDVDSLPPPPGGYPRRTGVPGSMISVPAPPPPRMNMMGGSPHQGGTLSPRLATTSFPLVRPDGMINSGEAFVPPMERGIDTSSGGEAGMAGVGRRGFAAAARAAMFVAQGPRPMGPQPHPPYNRKPMMQHLDLNAAARQVTETPPLSAGSGYSSHSPGPLSPLPNFSQQHLHLHHPSRIHRTPSPGQQHPDASTPIPIKTPGALALPPPPVQISGISHDYNNANASASASVSPHHSFFENYKDSQPPRMSPPNHQTLPNVTKAPVPATNHSMTVPISQSSSSASASVSASSASKGRGFLADPPSSAGSEYSGLAYADSTDYEDDEDERGRSLISPRGAPLKASILRSISNNSKVQFGSVSERSRSNDSGRKVRFNAARSTLRSESNSGGPTNHSRDNSVSSSYSSNAESDGVRRTRSNSSAIAQALGLSQTPPSDYRKLGGPGVYNVEGRLGRSGSGKSISGKSSDEKEKEKQATPPLPEKIPKMIIKQVSSSTASSSSGLSIALRERARDEMEEGNNLNLNLGPKTKAQRSNTVQGVVQAQSPDLKSLKLPMRALSEREKDKPAGVGEGKSGHGPRKEKAKKPKVCLKCAVTIENGRWVSTDGGVVLCEKCWKNMYLPKCRRCNLPIEKQAVSSSDGQLKGKYHKECFNCHECHKSFPDKTFYVYDGKPLCAYHYHEANDSLCAAARCGQPIEGPCAVSHTGDRYHPEHMTCEYPGSECGERLEEYWEVDGRMLCERHAVQASKFGNGDEERRGSGRKGMKRVTRFIDLAGGGINPPTNNRGEDSHGGDGDSGRRKF